MDAGFERLRGEPQGQGEEAAELGQERRGGWEDQSVAKGYPC